MKRVYFKMAIGQNGTCLEIKPSAGYYAGEHNGFQLIVHRSFRRGDAWQVSELYSGRLVTRYSSHHKTRSAAMQEAVEVLNSVSINQLERAHEVMREEAINTREAVVTR